MPSKTIPLAARKGVQVEDGKVIAVYQRGDSWKPYSDQESDNAIELIDKYLDGLKGPKATEASEVSKTTEDKLQDKIEDLEETIDAVEDLVEDLKAEKARRPRNIQEQVTSHIREIGAEQLLLDNPVNLSTVLRQVTIAQPNSVRFLKKKYGNATFTYSQWKELFLKENVIDS